MTKPMTQPDISSGPCIVCSEEALQGAAAICNRCGELYHLILTQDGEGKDCGDVWLNDDVAALEFACANCIAAQNAPPAGADPSPEQPSAPSTAPPTAQPERTTSAGRRTKHQGLSAREIVRRKRR